MLLPGDVGRLCTVNRPDTTSALPARILIVSWQRPGGKYAGAEVLRKIVCRLPKESFRWAYLGPTADVQWMPADSHRGFPPANLHWRLQHTGLNYWYVNNFQAPGIARKVAQWVEPFHPEVIWVLAELGAVNVARELHESMGLPVWATVHDAFENAHFFIPPSYCRSYANSVDRLMRVLSGLDCVSQELLNRVSNKYPQIDRSYRLVLPPSVAHGDMLEPGANSPWGNTALRRIGICGSRRISQEQWTDFAGLLGQMPYQFEIVLFAEESASYETGLPANVRVLTQPYAPSESDVIKRFKELGVCACYLGLWKEPERALFAKTSLSSKLTTYAAAGLPIIVDAPEDSVAWRIVKQYQAGILLHEHGAWGMAHGDESREQSGQDVGSETWDLPAMPRIALQAGVRREKSEVGSREAEGFEQKDAKEAKGVAHGDESMAHGAWGMERRETRDATFPLPGPDAMRHAPCSMRDGLASLFSDEAFWLRAAAGSARMCREEFDLERNVEKFQAELRDVGKRVPDHG